MKEFSFNLTLTPTYHKIVEYFLSIFISKQINLNFMEERRGGQKFELNWVQLKNYYISIYSTRLFLVFNQPTNKLNHFTEWIKLYPKYIKFFFLIISRGKKRISIRYLSSDQMYKKFQKNKDPRRFSIQNPRASLLWNTCQFHNQIKPVNCRSPRLSW